MDPMQAYLTAATVSAHGPRGELAVQICQLRGTPPGSIVSTRFGQLAAFQAVVMEALLMEGLSHGR